MEGGEIIATVTKIKPPQEELRTKLGATSPETSIDWLNVMIYSEPGAGKTHLLGTACEDGADTWPMLLLDIDGGVTTIQKLKIPEGRVDVIQIRSFSQIVNIYQELYKAIGTDGKLPYKTIGIDTFSELSKLDLGLINAEYAKDNPNIEPDVPDQRSYYKSGNHMRKITRGFRDLPCNVFFMSHLSTERDNLMRLCYFPQFPGKLKSDLPGFVDIVGLLRAEVKGNDVKRFLQTQKTETVIAKDRTGALLPVEEDPTIPVLWGKLKEIK